MSNKQDHKRWRREFNENCLRRDHNECVFCGKKEHLSVHHITDRHEMPNGGYVMANGITVCEYHHLVCEDWHVAGICENGHHPDDLYALIRSSYKLAYQASLNLK